ncbi:MAG TPA: lanthionine synthetase LanC family protein [Allosphingosinicella sp.]|nr:lanthionine synthetase LanC family protein [Allosphingosinicella sp.]
MALALNAAPQFSEAENTGSMLARLGLAAEWRRPWASVGFSDRRQGWKLHLSCSPLRLRELAQHLAEAHRDEPFAFKTVESVDTAMLLNEGALGATQVGKCATLYPKDDAQFVRLADRFARLGDLGGPVVPSDVRIGAAAYARYGGFNPIVRRDVLGQMRRFIDGPDGTLVDDHYDRKTTIARFVREFGGTPVARLARAEPPPAAGVIGGRYLVVGTLRESPKGDLLQAFDITEPMTPRALILKQGRAGLLADRSGHDMRERLLHQRKMHALVEPLGLAPHCHPCFTHDEDIFLPVEFQLNDNLEAAVQQWLKGRTIDALPPRRRSAMLRLLARISDLLAGLHRLGIVHRDVSPSNILLDAAGKPLLSDLELAWSATEDGPVYGKGTPGFMAPEQEAGARPDAAMDVHGFAALCLYVLTGLDPRRLPRPERSDEWRSLHSLCATVGDALWGLLRTSLDADPAKRPKLRILKAALDAAARTGPSPVPVPAAPPADGRDLLAKGVATLASPALLVPGTKLWLSAALDQVPGGGHVELRRSLNRGVAGPLYFCARYARHFPLDKDVRLVCRHAGAWLATDRSAPDFAMPGLHFGEAGVLVSLYAARAEGLVDFEDGEVAHLWALLDPEPEWLDITHGAAGMMLAVNALCSVGAFSEGERFDPDARIAALAERLCAAQESDGRWITPEGVPGMSGEVLTGFAHGVAGVAYVLGHFGRRQQNSRWIDAAARAGDWLLSSAVEGAGGSLQWRYGDHHPDPWIWWCHGAPGIARLFAELAQATGELRYRSAVPRCFGGVPRHFNVANLSLCHGIAGLGQLMLDLADKPGCKVLEAKADDIARIIRARHCRGQTDVYWIVEDATCVGADLMVGLTGVLHFLLRVETGDPTLTFPGLPPIASPSCSAATARRRNPRSPAPPRRRRAAASAAGHASILPRPS